MQRRPSSLELPFLVAAPEANPAAPEIPEPDEPGGEIGSAPQRGSMTTPRGQALATSAPAATLAVPGAPTELEEAPPERRLFSVAEFDRRLKSLVERATNDVDIEGEVSSLKVVSSGHAYFCLKDENEEASIDCVMYRSAPARSRKILAEGARVVITGRATVYAARGRLQFVAEHARLAGRGALLEALERLREKLASEGLFDPSRKRALPTDPKVIGVVTSRSGAAVHDIIEVAARRSNVRIVLSPSPVQGAGAAEKMIAALTLLEAVPEVEAIILGRGGGAADDLSAFNDEALVRKVASVHVPVISAVGHEIDITLTDLVADRRAATPSQAAELLVPDDRARRDALAHLERRLTRAVRHALTSSRHDLDALTAELGSPDRLFVERQQAIDEAKLCLREHARRLFMVHRAGLGALERRLGARHPRAVIAVARGTLGPLEVRLGAAMRRAMAAGRRDLGTVSARLDALSPLRVLGRGYAIVTGPEGRALIDAATVREGTPLRVRLHRGELTAEVREIRPELPPDQVVSPRGQP